MKNLTRTMAVLGAALGTSGAAALAATSCGGDDTQALPEGGPDAQGDHTIDVGSDVLTDDGPGADVDAGGGGDTGTDTGADGDGAAQFDAQQLYDYPHQVDVAYCQRLAFCCDGADASTFNLNKCASDLDSFGGIANVILALPTIDAGRITFDPTEAANCFNDLANIPCGSVSSQLAVQLNKDCAAALVGTVGLDGGCAESFECAPFAYCQRSASSDGGLGTCVPLQPIGGPCSDPASQDCTYRGNGVPAAYCNFTDAGNTCATEKSNGASCELPVECSSQICVGLCADSVPFSDPGTPSGVCDTYTIKDAGGG